MEKEIKYRVKRFALDIIKKTEKVADYGAAGVIKKQILRSGTSVGANYRAACAGKSKADFISKLCIAQEEADETMYWLELLEESGIVDKEIIRPLHKEANELLSIITASIKTARKND